MIILLIGIIVAATFFNSAFYEYRVLKNTDPKDIVNDWVNLQLKRRYK